MKSSETTKMNRGESVRLKPFEQAKLGKTEQAEEGVPELIGTEEKILPSKATLVYLRRRLVRQYGVPFSDVDDVIDDAVVSYLIARANGQTVRAGLFVVIACREACDRLRRRGLEIRHSVPSAGTSPPDLDRLQVLWLRRFARRFFGESEHLERRRIDALVMEIAGGAPWPEACQVVGIPRGSQSRYRRALQKCFRGLGAQGSSSARHHRGPSPDPARMIRHEMGRPFHPGSEEIQSRESELPRGVPLQRL